MSVRGPATGLDLLLDALNDRAYGYSIGWCSNGDYEVELRASGQRVFYVRCPEPLDSFTAAVNWIQRPEF